MILQKDKVLVTMLNPNGWRAPNVFGGAEIKTLDTLKYLKEYKFVVFLSRSLFEASRSDLIYSHIQCEIFDPIFKKTNVFSDLIQGLWFTILSLFYAFKYHKELGLIYSSTTNFSDILPAYICSVLFGKSLITKYHISIYEHGGGFLQIIKSYLSEKNTFLDSFVRAFFARITLHMLRHCNLVISVSKYCSNQLIACGLPAEKIFLSYNGLPTNKLSSLKVPGVTPKVFDLCSIGRIEKNKGLDDLIKAVSVLKFKLPFIKLAIIGDGTYLTELQSKVSRMGLIDNIKFCGFMGDDRFDVLQQARCFVSPSKAKEGFGLSLLEALYFGVPTIAYNIPVFVEIFGNISGINLIPPNVHELTKAIDSVLSVDIPTDFKADLSEYYEEDYLARERCILGKFISGSLISNENQSTK